MRTYKIVRFRSDGGSKDIKGGLTLEEAKEHCNDEDTSGLNDDGTRWFDGFHEE